MTDRHSVATVRDWLLEPATDAGIHLADETDGWTYRSYPELAELTLSVATLMREHGVPDGAGVCVIMPTGFPCVAAFYAVWACGGVFTPVAPPMFGDIDQYVAHVAAVLTRADPFAVVTSPELDHLIRRAMTDAGRTDEPLVLRPDAITAADPLTEFGTPAEIALLQFTSGSTGTPRGVQVSWASVAANVGMISRLIDWQHGDSLVSWLPLYHDMGLVGALLNVVTNQGDLYLMRPDQFVRDPARWLRAMTHVQHTPSPSFALGYVAHRVAPDEIAGLDLSGLRALAVGSEPVEVSDLQSFAALTAPLGFSMNAYTLAYGLAESTLMVTSSPRNNPITALRIDNPSLRLGEPVTVLEEARIHDGNHVEGSGWITGLGFSTPESTVTFVDENGNEVPDGTLGEAVVIGDSVAMGYSGAQSTTSSTRIANGRLYSGDAGFLYRGEVFILGRMGTSLKVRGRSVFMEDIESQVAQETGITKGKLAAVAITGAGTQGIALFAETTPGDWIGDARQIIRAELGPAHTVEIVTGQRGFIRRTSSGKPRRKHMWQLHRAGELDGAESHPDPADLPEPGAALIIPIEHLQRLLDSALTAVRLPADCAILLEGSIAEGFGNAGSDIDFLAVCPGDAELATLPTVLFIDGSRVEVRTRSEGQLRAQLARAAKSGAGGVDEDLLNRCQRFLRATVLRTPDGCPDIDAIRSPLPYAEFTEIAAQWWRRRAAQSLRFAVATAALHADDESAEWARDGVLQAAKGWAAVQGEGYIETKWLPHQLDRLAADPLVDRYRAVDAATSLDDILQLAHELGVAETPDDPHQVQLQRAPGVTTWPIDGRLHVLRGQDVFVLSDAAAIAWRSVVFGRSLREVLEDKDIGAELAEFVRLGFVRLRWRGSDTITPAVAMCPPLKPYSPVPLGFAPALSLSGAARGAGVVSLSPLTAARFAESALALVWSNVVLENAREDLAGAIKNAQHDVANIAAHRLVAMATRMVLSAFGIYPRPADVAPVPTVRRLIPDTVPERDRLVDSLRDATEVRFTGVGDDDGLATLDRLVSHVRELTGGEKFPAAFDSQAQWTRTLAIGYDWLRIGGYLNADLPIDEVRDLLTSGGQQPHTPAEGARS